MSFTNTISQLFGLTFLIIALSGVLLAFSSKLAIVALAAAFSMNVGLYVLCFFKAVTGDLFEDVDNEIHP